MSVHKSLVLLVFLVIACRESNAHDKGVWRMTPGDEIVEENSVLTLTCTYAYQEGFIDRNFSLRWELPEFLVKNPQVHFKKFFFGLFQLIPIIMWSQLMEVEERFRVTFTTNETHMSSTMTLANATARDTGLYRFVYGDEQIKRYIYVFG
jgi:hypothetical protein